jgi:hypothetical protein
VLPVSCPAYFLALIFTSERIQFFFNTKKQASMLLPATELEEGLKPDTAFDWLLLFSQCNVDDLATVCINYLLTRPASTLPDGFSSSGLQPKRLEQLVKGLQRKAAALQAAVRSLQAEVNALMPNKDAPRPHYGHRCSNCKVQWYMQPNG